MIVKMIFPHNKVGIGYERMVECDTVHKTTDMDLLELVMYSNGKLVETAKFNKLTGPVMVFVMENGKTVDRIDFKIGGAEEQPQ